MNEEEKELEFVEIGDNNDEVSEDVCKSNSSHTVLWMLVGAGIASATGFAVKKGVEFVGKKIDNHHAKRAAKEQAKINAIEPDFEEDEVEG